MTGTPQTLQLDAYVRVSRVGGRGGDSFISPEQQRDKIERHRLAGFFDVIVIEGEFGAGKPDEVVYRHALR